MVRQRQKLILLSWPAAPILTTADPKSFSNNGVCLGAVTLNTKERDGATEECQNYVNLPFIDVEVRVSFGNYIIPWDGAGHCKSTKNQHKNNS